MLYESAYQVTPQKSSAEDWCDDFIPIAGNSPEVIEKNILWACGKRPLERCPPLVVCSYCWGSADERRATRFNGWYVGLGGRAYNLYRSPSTVLYAHDRQSIRQGMVNAVNKDFTVSSAYLGSGFAAQLVDTNLQLCRLALLAHEYTLADVVPTAGPFAVLEEFIFEVLEPFWPEIKRRWSIEAQRNPRSSQYLGEQQNV
jgi:hypothetical protein